MRSLSRLYQKAWQTSELQFRHLYQKTLLKVSFFAEASAVFESFSVEGPEVFLIIVSVSITEISKKPFDFPRFLVRRGKVFLRYL